MNKIIQAVSIFSAVVMFGGVAMAGNLTKIQQIGGVSDIATSSQTGENLSIDFKQTSVGQQNYATNLQTGADNSTVMEQIAGASLNRFRLQQHGKNNKIGIFESATGLVGNRANDVNIFQSGENNQFAGASAIGGFDGAEKAAQISTKGSNLLHLKQKNLNNKLGLYQSAVSFNSAVLTQLGNGNLAVGYQKSVTLSNTLRISQNGGDSATVVQTSTVGANSATIDQF